jgi:hypothetical protein
VCLGRALAGRSNGPAPESACPPWQQRHEGELPTALVKNKGGCATYEAAVRVLTVLAQ